MAPFLPPEILGIIISFVFDLETLLALRLVSQSWRYAVDAVASQLIQVSISSESLERFYRLAHEDRASNRVRTLVWDLPDHRVGACLPDEAGGHAVEAGLDGLKLLWDGLKAYSDQFGRFVFNNLAHMSVHIRPVALPEESCTQSNSERQAYLFDMFDRLLRRMDGLHGLVELSIRNIPVEFPGAVLLSAQDVLPAMPAPMIRRGLESLQLSFVGSRIWPPRGDERRARRGQSFLAHLFLSPVCSTLRHLSLSYWGFYMKNLVLPPWSEFRIPKLQTLKIHSCGFTSPEVLMWILHHAGTLRSLKLDDCAIVYSLRIVSAQEFQADHEGVSLVEHNDHCHQNYQHTWARWFEEIRNGLPHLQRFDIGSSRVRQPGERFFRSRTVPPEGPKFGHVNEFFFGLFPDRYLAMTNETESAPFVLQTRTHCTGVDSRPRNDSNDRAELRRLLEHLNQSVRENDTSNHATTVRKLMGVIRGP